MRLQSFLTAGALMFVSAAASAQWGPETPMTKTGGDVWGEGMAATGSTIHMIYGSSDINYLRSSDEGANWTASKQIGSGTVHLTDPLVADGQDVWAVYLDNIQNLSDWCCSRDMGNIWLLHSGDGGDNWNSPVQLSAPNTAFRLSLAYAANRLHLVWMDYRGGGWDTYYRRSPDRGKTWDPEVVIAQSMGPFGAERPQVAARGDSVHVTIWDDRAANPSCKPGTYTFPKCPDVFHIRSTNGGENWGTITNVANGGAYFAGRNDVAVAGTSSVVINFNVDVAGQTGSKLFAVGSSDDGKTWGTPTQLTTSPNSSDHGSIVGYGNSAFLVWHDDRDPSNREIYYRETPDGGGTWNQEEQVSSGALGDSSTPLNAVTPGYAHVMWIDNREGSYQVYYRRRAITTTQPPVDGGAAGASAGGTSGNTGNGGSTSAGGTNAGGFGGNNTGGSKSDAGMTDEDGGEDTGCGCQLATRTTSLWWSPMLLLVLGLRGRSRRTRREASPPRDAVTSGFRTPTAK